MKKLLALILLFLTILQVQAQLNPMDHLFKDKPRDLNFYINPVVQFSQIDLQSSTIPGFGVGMIIHKKILIGVQYNLTLKDINLPSANGSGNLKMRWGGLHLEYTLWPLQMVHLTFPLTTGVGKLSITGNTNGTLSGTPNFLFAESGMIIEFNIWKYAKLGLGTTYRYTGNVSYNSITSGDLSGFAAVASLKFGMFKYLKRDLDKLKY